MFVYHILCSLRFSWMLVLSIYKEDYLQILNVVLLITQLLRLAGRLSWFNHTSGVAFVATTDRLKSVRNRYVIEVLVTFIVLSRCFWGFFLYV